MTKLTTTQYAALSSARDREDGLAARPANLRAAAAAKLVASLIAKGFVKEIRAKLDAPVWREDEDGRFALKLLKAGRLAAEAQAETDIQAEPPAAVGASTATDKADTQAAPDDAPQREAPAAAKKTRSSTSVAAVSLTVPVISATSASAGSKRDRVIALLRRPDGAAMAELIAATGWLPHTTRAALSGLRKSGLMLERFRNDELTTCYRIPIAAGSSASAAAAV